MAVVKHISKNVAEKVSDSASKAVDQRVARTRAQIDAAFVAMLHRRAYDGIRVGDITRKAGVGRATFYAHYATKHDLLQSQLRRIVCPMLVGANDSPCPIDATVLFAHIAASPRIYLGLMTGATGPAVQAMLLRCFEERLRQLLPTPFARGKSVAELPEGLALRFIASTLLTLVGWCVESPNTEDAARMQTMYAALIGGCSVWRPGSY